jgi:hypothetical protein
MVFRGDGFEPSCRYISWRYASFILLAVSLPAVTLANQHLFGCRYGTVFLPVVITWDSGYLSARQGANV